MIYGDQLAFFSEQRRQFDYFHMSPNNVASYSQRDEVKKVTGIFQFVKAGELKRENETLDEVEVPTFWTKTKLKVGDYFIQKVKKSKEKSKEELKEEDEEDIPDIYRIKKPADWSFEGGFYIYILETFVGSSDTQEPFEYVDIGQNSYD